MCGSAATFIDSSESFSHQGVRSGLGFWVKVSEFLESCGGTARQMKMRGKKVKNSHFYLSDFIFPIY